MIQITLDRVLVRPDELKREHKVEGSNISLVLAAPAQEEARQEAGIRQGYIVSIGPTAYTEVSRALEGREVPEDARPKVNDFVLWARYSGVGVEDPETGEKLVILNDEDVLCILKRGETK